MTLPESVRTAVGNGGRGLTVLVLRLGAMGDIVRTLPAVRLVRRGLPDARIHWVAWEPWTVLLEGHPDLDGTIAVPRRRLRELSRSVRGWPALTVAIENLIGSVRALRPSLALDFHGDLRTGLLGLTSGASVRIGYEGHQQKEGNRWLTTHRVPAGSRRRCRIERNLDLVRALSLAVEPLPDAGLPLDIHARSEAAAIRAALIGGGGEYAVINPGASRAQRYKKPPAGLLAAAAVALAERQIRPVVVCGPGEEDDARQVVDSSRGAAAAAPPTSIPALAALLSGARLFVGGDSGPLHLACGVGCPVVALYGPTDPVVNAPWRVPYAALSAPHNVYTGIKRQDRAVNGFSGLTEDAVAAGVAGVLARPRATAGDR